MDIFLMIIWSVCLINIHILQFGWKHDFIKKMGRLSLTFWDKTFRKLLITSKYLYFLSWVWAKLLIRYLWLAQGIVHRSWKVWCEQFYWAGRVSIFTANNSVMNYKLPKTQCAIQQCDNVAIANITMWHSTM